MGMNGKEKRMTVSELCEQLGFPAEVRERITEAERTLDFGQIQTETAGLADPEQYDTARTSLKKKLGEDPCGWKMLACMLRSMVLSRKQYEEKQIPGTVFVDTMKAFTRFVGEHKDSFGEYGFDRDFWTGRQLSLLLFRLGELEFEMTREKNEQGNEEPAVSIHIPSDADLSREKCLASFREARSFFGRYYPEFSECRYVCYSWLMSPALKDLLPDTSRIRQFQDLFEVVSWEKEADDVLEWVFKRKDLPLEKLPEDTSLQRRMKQYLLNGGAVGEAGAVLSPEVFSENFRKAFE